MLEEEKEDIKDYNKDIEVWKKYINIYSDWLNSNDYIYMRRGWRGFDPYRQGPRGVAVDLRVQNRLVG